MRPETPLLQSARHVKGTDSLTCRRMAHRRSNDTPTAIGVLVHNPTMISHMSDYGLRARRENGAPTALIAGLVAKRSRHGVQHAAKASGVTISYYLDTLLLGMVKEHGALPLVEPPLPDRSKQLEVIADILGAGDEGAASTKPVWLQARVSPEAHTAVYDAIETSGVKKTYYLEGLIKKLMTESEDGTLPLVDPPRRRAIRRDRANQIEEIRKFSEVASRSAA